MDEKRIPWFWEKVNKSAENGCWEWTAYTTPVGYGHFNIGSRMDYAHRISFKLKYGPIPDNMCVLHKCDNRKCVNPEHLFLGTQTDNMVDKTKKNRQNQKTTHWNHYLTEKDVVLIRWLADNKLASHENIAKFFKTRRENIGKIYRRERWKNM